MVGPSCASWGNSPILSKLRREPAPFPPTPQPEPSAGGTLQDIGYWSVWAGALALIGTVIARFLVGANPVVAEIAVIGAAILGLGCCFFWLAANLWVIWVAVAIVAVVLAVRYRRFWLRGVPRPHVDTALKQD